MKSKLIPYYIYITFVIALIFPVLSSAQTTSGSNFKNKLFYGGGLGLQFGSTTLIDVSPMIGYKVSENFGIGLSATYKYYKYKTNYGNNESVTTHVFGGSVFARYLILPNLFAQIEYEKLVYNIKTSLSMTQVVDFDSFFVGGGYRQPIGNNVFMNMMVLWNLNDNTHSPYQNPVIRMGIGIGF